MTKQLIKTVDIGPYSIKEYTRVKLTKYKEDPGELDFLIGYLYNYIGNNISKILERRFYYLENDSVITDIHYYYDQIYNKVALNRKITPFGTQKDICKPTIGEPVWICPPDVEDVHEYNDTNRKIYYKLEKKLNLYLSDSTSDYKLPEKSKRADLVKTVTNSNGFKFFKVNKDTMDRINKKKPKDAIYKVVTKSDGKSNSIVIKNIPKDTRRETAYSSIKEMFIKFGGISKLTILSDKIDNTKLLGIGFIDFYNPASIDKIFKSNTKFILNHSVLLLERQKPKKNH